MQVFPREKGDVGKKVCSIKKKKVILSANKYILTETPVKLCSYFWI